MLPLLLPPNSDPPCFSSHGSNYEQPTKDGLNSDNIGNKMLQAMGWQEGKGLGRRQQGITAPIEVSWGPHAPANAAASPERAHLWPTLGAFPSHSSFQLSELSEAPLTPVSSLSVFRQASLRTKGAGLGTKGSSYELSATDTYKDIVRKALFARFTELE